jgi:hypothetical protein
MFVRGRLIVSGDATATAEKIMTSEFLWRLGIAGHFFFLICAVALALVFYILFRPVSRDIILLAIFFNLVSITIEAVSTMHSLSALFPLGDALYLKALDPKQLYALSYFSNRWYAHGYGVSLIFFGCVCIILGYLIFRSGYLPKVIGVLMQVAGLSYLTNSFALILSPPLADWLFPAVLLPAFVGEVSFCLWLLVKGVNVSKWNARANSKPAPISLSGV